MSGSSCSTHGLPPFWDLERGEDYRTDSEEERRPSRKGNNQPISATPDLAVSCTVQRERADHAIGHAT
jgi:hypothetical protein